MQTWTEEDDRKIMEMIAAGKTREQIAAALGTSKSAICGRVYRLGGQPSFSSASDEIVESLRWFQAHEPVAGLDVIGERPPFTIFPTRHMRDHLCERGLLEAKNVLGLLQYQTTEAGRAILREALQQTPGA